MASKSHASTPNNGHDWASYPEPWKKRAPLRCTLKPKVGNTLTCGACGTTQESKLREAHALGWRVRNGSPNMRLICPACAVETDW